MPPRRRSRKRPRQRVTLALDFLLGVLRTHLLAHVTSDFWLRRFLGFLPGYDLAYVCWPSYDCALLTPVRQTLLCSVTSHATNWQQEAEAEDPVPNFTIHRTVASRSTNEN